MGLIKILKLIFSSPQKKVSVPEQGQTSNGFSIEKRALHEAAHGIVWYLFKDYWIVNRLTINPDGLPDKSMNGALHISANFNVKTETNIQRANEITAIALAGMIGQNIEIILQRDMITLEIINAKHFKDILDTTGCGGDFEIVMKYLKYLSQEFKTSDYNFLKFKIMDLISIFQEHNFVQQIHKELSQLLIGRGSIEGKDLIDFLESKNFQDYIEDQNLDINFFHNR
jgi:hypothetical protein